ncbi:hypothetical protein [Actinoplanes sp. NBRC 103695]|uniref:hypothetical protein n=1 Tax=Actinoplanes sp. NBRC 103695 TaxID=3032202 RepID=UPI0024A37067|nr:hypothetical protein [Actinoplanes sp. NBRC 103695]GLY99646.1 hypothetical protein Acsp02_68990 [Actinoplanes sp. NBRC 103695]
MTIARSRRPVAAVAAAVLCIGIVPASASAAPSPGPADAVRQHQRDERRANFDGRVPDARTLTALRTKQRSAGVTKLDKGLGAQGLVDIDPATGTARRVARVDGFLTTASDKPAKEIATGYVAANPEVFGLSAAETAALRLRKDYVDIDGTHHLSFEQVVGGVPVFGNGVKAAVTKHGELVPTPFS